MTLPRTSAMSVTDGTGDTGGSAVPLLTRLFRPGKPSALEYAAVGALVVAFLVVAAWVSRIPLLLGHDESVYAILARHWLSGTPDTGVAAHRAPLLPFLGVPVLAAGGGELGLRAWGIASGVVAVLGVWWLGRSLRGPVAGLLAAAVFIFSPTVVEASTEYLTDLPATALLVLLMALLWHQLAVRGAPSRALYLAAPLACGAYLLRYGSALVVVLVFATAWVAFRDKIRDHLGLVLRMLALLGLLLLAHLVNATLDLGHPIARLLYTSEIAGREYLGEGLVDYLRWFPLELAGPATAALMAVGLVGAGIVWVTGQVGPGLIGPAANQRRALAFLLLPALGHVLAIGIASHGEPRFVFFPIALVSVAGAIVVANVLATLQQGGLSGVVWVALVGAVIIIAAEAAWVARDESRDRDTLAQRYTILQQSAEAINQRGGDDCSVLSGYTPQITWMTGCSGYSFGDPPVEGRERFLSDDAWMALYEEGKGQPQAAVRGYYLGIADEVLTWDPPQEGHFGSGTLYRLETADE